MPGGQRNETASPGAGEARGLAAEIDNHTAANLPLFHLFKDGVDIAQRTQRHFRNHFPFGRELEGFGQILTGADQGNQLILEYSA